MHLDSTTVNPVLPADLAPTRVQYLNRFNYRGYFGRPAFCHLTVFERPDGVIVFIATQSPGNTGTSITNAVESLAMDAVRCFIKSGQHWTWIERYPVRGQRDEHPESFSRVQFQAPLFDKPVWSTVPRHRIAELIGITERELIQILPFSERCEICGTKGTIENGLCVVCADDLRHGRQPG